MTPEEMGVALGSGWEPGDFEPGAWVATETMVTVEPMTNGRYDVIAWSKSGEHVPYSCSTPEAAVATAHLLVAAERVSGGAEVASPFGWRGFSLCGVERVWVNEGTRSLPEARRLAIDLLRLRAADAADEAEAQT